MALFRRFIFQDEQAVSLAASGNALPDVFLIVPGNYVIEGVAYDMSAGGYYLYFNPATGTTIRRLVINANALSACSTFSWATIYGDADSGLTRPQKDEKAKTSKLSLLCEDTVAWVQFWLAGNYFQTRKVHVLTAETPNNYTDGHVSIEVQHNGSWVMVDCAFGQYFSAGQNPLSLRDFIPRAASWDVDKKKLADDNRFSATKGIGTFDMASFLDLELRTEAQRDSWMRSVFQIPGIQHTDGLTYFYLPAGTEGRQSYVEGLSPSYRVVTKSIWDGMFY